MYGPYVSDENMIAEDNELLWVNSASQLLCLEQNLMSDMLPTPGFPKILRECKLLLLERKGRQMAGGTVACGWKGYNQKDVQKRGLKC